MEAYIQEAIKEGVEVFGFSDHAPLQWDAEYRMAYEEMDDYEREFHQLREKYAGEIKLILGYEADYLPFKMYSDVFRRKVDYLIGSVHFLGMWGLDNPSYIGEFQQRGIGEVWREYFGAIRDMARCGMYEIVGHMDLIKIFGHFPSKKPDKSVTEALVAIKKAGMAIEINCSGWSKPVGEQYPSRAILESAYDLGVPITFGSDSHSPRHIAKMHETAYALARSIGYQEACYFEDHKMHMVKI